MLGCTGERKQIFELAFGQGLTKMYKCTNIASPPRVCLFPQKISHEMSLDPWANGRHNPQVKLQNLSTPGF